MNKKVWYKFFEPFRHALSVILGFHALISLGFLLPFFFGNPASPPPEWIIWSFVYPGIAYLALIGLSIVIEAAGGIVSHYKHCVNEVYREEHNIPYYCECYKEHRLYHAIGEKCPCRK